MTRQWFVCETHHGAEPTALDNLESQSFATLYPSCAERGKEPKPYFPHYIFVQFDLMRDRWQAINNTRGVKRLLFGTCPIPISAKAMDRVHELCALSPLPPVERATEVLLKGMKLRFVDGPLQGQLATCDNIKKNRVSVLMALFGHEISFTIPRSQVARA